LENIKERDFNLIKEKIENCQKCPLALTRNKTVCGEGNIDSPVIFIGEGPGAEEDTSGRPFVGRAGQLLEKMILMYAKRKREDFFIGNIVKCRPPQNRVPSEEEVRSCTQFLEAQLLVIKPKIIVTLGATSARFFLGRDVQITKERGSFFDWYGNVKIFTTFHPSYLLRNQSKEKFSPFWYAALDMTLIGIMHQQLSENRPVDEVINEITIKLKGSTGE